MSWMESSLERYRKFLEEQQSLDRSHAAGDQPSRFTPRVQKIFQLAHTEAKLLRHDYVGTEHLLLGILRLNLGKSAKILRKEGLELSIARQLVCQSDGFDYPLNGQPPAPFTPRAKRVIQQAERLAEDTKHMLVGTEHLLIALLQEKGGLASKILTQYGISQETYGVDLFFENTSKSEDTH
ncbi:MAG: ATP-dependent Clp protease ATP-binding protein [Verrucomicrobiales bacterium]|nr:ATP-dependent Clp protease ATP-binding protein [Verrucomicrobiales bacterium]